MRIAALTLALAASVSTQPTAPAAASNGLAGLAPAAPPAATPSNGPAGLAPAAPPAVCDGKPVLMVIRGLIHDRERIMKYGAAIRDSGLYDRLGAYYINVPRALATFEGAPPANDSVLIVRFPCLAHARAFWNSKAYQETIVPLRRNPSAGDFTVTVYPELAPPPYMNGRVESGAYTALPEQAVAAGVAQAMPTMPRN